MGFSITKELASIPIENRAMVESRLNEVRHRQLKLGMQPRDDSQLTFRFALGMLDADETAATVANELIIVDALYKKTPYGDIIEDVLREIAHHVRKRYRLPWGDTWDIVRFYGPTMLKLHFAKSMQSD